MRKLEIRDFLMLARATMVLGAGLFVSAGCGQRLSDSNLDQVVPDMSKKEVESILGQPTSIKTHELTLQTQMKTLTATRYYYDQQGQKVELIFVADKLVGKNGHFNPDSVQDTRVAEKANTDQPIPGLEPGERIMEKPPAAPGIDLPEENQLESPVIEPPLPEEEAKP